MPRTVAPRRRRPSHIYNSVERTGLRKGMGGSKPWLYVGTGLWALRIMRRLGERREELLIQERLRPGDRLIIANDRPTLDGAPAPTPRGRRARTQERKQQARQAKRDAKAARSRKARKAAKQAKKQAKRVARSAAA
jgi:hypothetical protein